MEIKKKMLVEERSGQSETSETSSERRYDARRAATTAIQVQTALSPNLRIFPDLDRISLTFP